MNVCVFCGSNTGVNPVYAQAARELGSALAREDATLVYGGGNVGLMGVIADAVMQNGGKVVGVIPDFLLQREVGHRGITTLEVVENMHQRKKRMADLSDVFIAMPGGWGTLEELFEVLTWKQLTIIPQPVGLLNVNGFFDPMLEQMKLMVEEKFLSPKYLQLLQIHNNAQALLNSLLQQVG